MIVITENSGFYLVEFNDTTRINTISQTDFKNFTLCLN